MAKKRGNGISAGKVVLVGGGAALALLYLPRIIAAAQVGGNLKTQFRGLEFGRVVGTFPVFRLQMNLLLNAINPTGATAKIDFINLNLTTPDGVSFADITRTDANYNIGPRSNTILKIPVELNLTTTLVSVLFPAVISLITNKVNNVQASIGQQIKNALPQSLRMTGNIRVNSFRVPVTQTIAVIKPNTNPPAPQS